MVAIPGIYDAMKALMIGKEVGILLAVRQSAGNALNVVKVRRQVAEVDHLMQDFARGAGVFCRAEFFKTWVMQAAEFGVGRKATGTDDDAGTSTDVLNPIVRFYLDTENTSGKRLFANDGDNLGFRLDGNALFFRRQRTRFGYRPNYAGPEDCAHGDKARRKSGRCDLGT